MDRLLSVIQKMAQVTRPESTAKIEILRSTFEPLRLEMIEGTQYDRNWELFVNAVLDLLGEEDSETQFTNFLRS